MISIWHKTRANQNPKPRVSVLLPVNSFKYINDTLNSILSQEYEISKIQVVIILSNPQDKLIPKSTMLILRKLNYKIVIADEPGIVAALNLGITNCDAEFIVRIDQDDIMSRNRINSQINYLQKKPSVACVGGQIRLINEKNRTIGYSYFPVSKFEIHLIKFTFSPMAHPAVTFRKSVIEQLNGYPNQLPEDWLLWLKLLSKFKIKNLPMVVISYRVHKEQLSRNKDYSEIISRETIIKDYFNSNFRVTESNIVKMFDKVVTTSSWVSISRLYKRVMNKLLEGFYLYDRF